LRQLQLQQDDEDDDEGNEDDDEGNEDEDEGNEDEDEGEEEDNDGSLSKALLILREKKEILKLQYKLKVGVGCI
jgi:hypothetical protein